MYSKQEASRLKEEFWTTFGQYMSPVLSAEGTKINWINYKSGEQHIHFRMEADNEAASIGIELSHPSSLRELYFEQLQQLKHLLEEAVGEVWIWVPEYHDKYGKVSSRVYIKLSHVSVLRREDWQALISFFKPRIMALDAFWSQARYAFEALK